MREFILIGVGNSGINLNASLINNLLKEHEINIDNGEIDKPVGNLNIFFNEYDNKKYLPRALFADYDPYSIDKVKASPIGKLISPDFFISGKVGTGNNFAKGFYGPGFVLIF